MHFCLFNRIVFSVLVLCLCGSVCAQWEDPLVIDDNYRHYEYPIAEGAPLEVGRPPAGNGSVIFVTNPPGARVFIDDVYQGETPLLIDNVADGTYSVRFEKDGYLNYYGVFDVASTLQSNVTAGLQPRTIFLFDRRELYTTLIYEHSGMNAQEWGVGNSWGVYFKNINLEQSTVVHIGVSNTVSFEGALGYGFIIGHLNRFRIVPQIGYAGVWYDHVDTAVSGLRGYLRGAVKFKCAINGQYAFSSSLLYDKTGPGFRVGVLFYVN